MQLDYSTPIVPSTTKIGRTGQAATNLAFECSPVILVITVVLFINILCTSRVHTAQLTNCPMSVASSSPHLKSPIQHFQVTITTVLVVIGKVCNGIQA